MYRHCDKFLAQICSERTKISPVGNKQIQTHKRVFVYTGLISHIEKVHLTNIVLFFFLLFTVCLCFFLSPFFAVLVNLCDLFVYPIFFVFFIVYFFYFFVFSLMYMKFIKLPCFILSVCVSFCFLLLSISSSS